VPVISGNGQVVVFATKATNLVTGITGLTGSRFNIYARNLAAGTTVLVSINPAGTACGNRDSSRSDVSSDGRVVTFETDASNLVAGDANQKDDVFARNLVANNGQAANTTEAVSVKAAGLFTAIRGADQPAVSFSGQFVAFSSSAINLTTDDANGAPDVFLRDVAAGTTVALVGHTGAGKSTIAKLLARFYDPREGRITIDGHDLRDVTQESLRRQLGIVPQEGFLFAGTVEDNISFGRPGASPEDVVTAASAVGAHDFVLRLEDGYETHLQERGLRLSLGQRQLVALARAFLADPRVLILDEPTSSVDIGTERRIERALRTLLSGRTAFVIAHRLSTIRDADLIVVLEHGRVVEQGTHDELLRRRGLYTSLYGDCAEVA